MISILRWIALTLGVATGPACTSEEIGWPNLPTRGFISGRAATLEDIKLGNAVFSLDGRSKGALSLDIPQYVIWTDEGGAKHPMILVQAELAPDNSKIVGLRAFDGTETAATMPELSLLGTKKPK